MATINWLHFSDLHYGIQSQKWLWPNMRAELYRDLRKLSETAGPWDVVIFSGDLVQQGKKDEYAKLTDELNRLWEHFASFGNAPVLIAVPGNHDLERPGQESLTRNAFSVWDENQNFRESFWSNEKSDSRAAVNQFFQNYTDWWSNLTLPKPKQYTHRILPGDFSTVISKNGLRFGVIGLNSTFLQIGAGDFEGKLDLHEQQLHAVCSGDPATWLAATTTSYLVTHQPPNWLTSEAHSRFIGEIYTPGRFFAHLTGHLHESKTFELSEAGAKPRRFRQAPSLFGLEEWQHKNGARPRTHGYTAGRIEVNGPEGMERLWPRIAVNMHAGGLKLKPDHRYELDDLESIVTPFEVPQNSPTNVTLAIVPVSEQLTNNVNPSISTEERILETELNADSARVKLQNVPRLQATLLPQHVAIRQEEQATAELVLRKTRCLWVIAEWGLGKEGFLRAALERLNISGSTIEIFSINCEDALNIEQLQNHFLQQAGMSLQQFSSFVAVRANPILIFDGLTNAFTDSATKSESTSLNNLIRLLLDYCPSLRIVLTTAHKIGQSPFEHITLQPLEIPEVRTYVELHPDGNHNVNNAEIIDRLHERSDGLPLYLDKFLKALKASTLKQVLDSDIASPLVKGESMPKSIKQAIITLSRSEDRTTQRSWRLLKVLTVLANGESIERLKRFFPNEPFHADNALQLNELGFLDVVLAHAAIPKIEATKRVSAATVNDIPKLLRVPRQIRDYVKTTISKEEHLEIVTAAAEFYFGRNWRGGKIRLRADSSNQSDTHGAGAGNEFLIVHHLLHEGIEESDRAHIRRAARLGINYLQQLDNEHRFRDGCISGEAIFYLLEQSDCDDLLAEVAASYGTALRMTSHWSDAVKILNVALEKGGAKLSKEFRAGIYVDLALAHERLENKQETIEAARLALEATAKDTQRGLHAQAILDGQMKEGEELIGALEKLARKAQEKGYTSLANTFAISLERKSSDDTRSLKLLDDVLKHKDDEYNCILAVVNKAELLIPSKRISELSFNDLALLEFAFGYLYAQRLGRLFERCTNVISLILLNQRRFASLIRLYRYSSFVFRLNDNQEKEKKLFEFVKTNDPVSNISPTEKMQIAVELEYFERRNKSLLQIASPELPIVSEQSTNQK